MIGGNVMTEEKVYYIRKSGLRSIRTNIERYVKEVMTEVHYVGITDITSQVIYNLTEEIYHDVNRMLEKVYNKPASVVFGDSTVKRSSPLFYKRNNYNLNLLGERCKIKVWLGPTARVARENFMIASEKYPEYHKDFFVDCIDTGMYRIECYHLVRGYTVDDLLRKEVTGAWYDLDNTNKEEEKEKYVEKFTHSNSKGCLMTSIIESYFNFIAGQIHATRYWKKIYYPNDCNPGNFVIDYDSVKKWPYNMVMMDFDHMIITNPKHMIHSVSWQFFSRIFDIENLTDDDAKESVVKWRKENDLFEVIENFKIRYFETVNIEYNSDEECFKYNVPHSTLNNSTYLIDYVEAKKEEKIKPVEEKKVNEHGAEIIDESEYDDDDLE